MDKTAGSGEIDVQAVNLDSSEPADKLMTEEDKQEAQKKDKEPNELSELEENLEKLALDSDIYSYTFFKFVTDHNPIEIGELMTLCFLTFLLQISVIAFLLQETLKDGLGIFLGDRSLNFIRLISTYIMHLHLFPKVQVSLQMLNFTVYNSEKFSQQKTLFPLVLLSAKVVAAVLTQFFSIYAMMNFNSVTKVITGFVSHGIIGNIASLMAMTLTKINIGSEIGKQPIMYKMNTKIFDDRLLLIKWSQWLKED